jgi:hypothetical protein
MNYYKGGNEMDEMNALKIGLFCFMGLVVVVGLLVVYYLATFKVEEDNWDKKSLLKGKKVK